MKCPKCNKKNIVKANYCIECNYNFTEEEQEKAYKKTFIGKIDRIQTWYEHLTLATITDHILFKIFLLVLVLLTGLWYYHTRGINTTILESKNYEVYYNKSSDEYYLLIDNESKEVKLNIYRPNRVKTLELIHYDENDKELDKIELDENSDGIDLKSYNHDYYVLSTIYNNKKEEKMKLFVYPKNRIPTESS